MRESSWDGLLMNACCIHSSHSYSLITNPIHHTLRRIRVICRDTINVNIIIIGIYLFFQFTAPGIEFSSQCFCLETIQGGIKGQIEERFVFFF